MWNDPESSISGHFELFLDPLTHSKALHTTKEVNLSMLKGPYSPKILQKIVLPEIGFISIFFLSENDRKVPKMSYFMQF